ncbi:DUF4102 domain-containing protein [Sulfurimonas sediminis]|uniref:DUF4102 domain-containing protein n=1 Tax=Sulfurimonas sediminis TaxID=2590020 RepID=A0A7M1AYE0_9BACT|nr:integrase arm-type DNA-binding domain-containing protein [Sulfurimonas sediminis]QOP42473.1 DUF4102 domain-containing protein [Sulfurimonas sediminis]
MARKATPLTDTQIRQAKPKEKEYKLFDGGGLYLSISPKGGKWWRMKYMFEKKEHRIALGTYPNVSLREARKQRDTLKEKIVIGIDPAAEKKERKKQIKQNEEKKQNTFKKVALEKLQRQLEEGISESHYKRTLRGFINDTFPFIGDMLIDEVVEDDILNIIETMHKRGVKNSIQKVYSAINKTFKYAVAKRYTRRNPCVGFDLSEIIGKVEVTNYATFTNDTDIKNLIISTQQYQGEISTKYALLWLLHTAVRPTNARLALWEEIDTVKKQWIIPAKKMKTKNELIVPLSYQLLDLLEDIRLYNGDSPYLFPSIKSKTVPLSDGALLGAIRRMGYTKEEFTPHGARSMFSTIAHEKSPFNHEAIETQLAHSVGSSVSQAYNRAKYLDERVELMQWWSDYLDEVQK